MTGVPLPPTDTVHVLSSPGPTDARPNITVKLLNDFMPESVVVSDFTWKRAFLSSYDLLHIHWPEGLLGSRRGAIEALRALLLTSLVWWNKLRRRPAVITMHNLEPHERLRWAGRAAYGTAIRRADARVYMYESAIPNPPTSRDVCIKRGDYAPHLVHPEDEPAAWASDSGPLRFLQFGLMRPYKGIEQSIAAFADLDPQEFALTVAGQSVDDGYLAELRELVALAPPVSLLPERLSDEDLEVLIRAAHAVILPYKRMYNSGAALLALTIGVPIIVTSSATMEELRDEAGADWVYLLPSTLDASELKATVSWLKKERSGKPSLADRQWPAVSRRYADLYQRLVHARI